ncbi:acetolactate synthase [Bifidobacterium catenulatum DSM 16992 = JCM 1194 = LMG 11043]|nr:acetolactate synthase [Bifidobacterium catenulatum DSM 16992 = JCM 1194 = LMG 11043]
MYPASQPGSKRHTLSVLVENRPGVLARIAGLFARRAFNINSLSVSPTERPDISRVTVTAEVDEVPLEQIIKQLNKLLHVLKIVDLDPETTVERELVLIKVAADESNRSDVLEIVRLFRVRVVDVNPESLTIEATGAEGKIDALLGAFGALRHHRAGSFRCGRRDARPEGLERKGTRLRNHRSLINSAFSLTANLIGLSRFPAGKPFLLENARIYTLYWL